MSFAVHEGLPVMYVTEDTVAPRRSIEDSADRRRRGRSQTRVPVRHGGRGRPKGS